MSFCQQCGTEAAVATLFCAGCGANVTAPDVKAHDPNAPLFSAYADLGAKWVHNFALMEQAGGVRLPRLGALALGDRARLLVNIWALIFGPLYYAVKGMWRKGLALLLAVTAVLLLVTLAAKRSGVSEQKILLLACIVIPVIFATRANIDYYKKMVLGDNGWW